MVGDVVVGPMTEDLILWRCLHSGPLSRGTLDEWPADSPLPWAAYRERNVPLLGRLTQTYGACAIVARDGDRIVGQLRFYPKAVEAMDGAGGLCLQQDYPSGPADDFADRRFPALAEIADRTLAVHCLMTGSPQQTENPYQRRGIGGRMVRALAAWAAARGWAGIEARAFEDIPIIYEITGSAGRTFWEKQGFSLAARQPHPDLKGQDPFIDALEAQAESMGIPRERAKDQLIMRLDLA